MKPSSKIFLILLLTVLPVLGQNVTKDSVCVSLKIAKQIETDLTELDRLKANNTENNLYKCIENQEKTMSVNEELKFIIREKENQLEAKEERISNIEMQLKQNHKSGNGWLFGIGGVTLGIIGTLLLLR